MTEPLQTEEVVDHVYLLMFPKFRGWFRRKLVGWEWDRDSRMAFTTLEAAQRAAEMYDEGKRWDSIVKTGGISTAYPRGSRLPLWQILRFPRVKLVPVACSAPTASWCPNHGKCTCPEDDDPTKILDVFRCPLHGMASDHPLPVEGDIP